MSESVIGKDFDEVDPMLVPVDINDQALNIPVIQESVNTEPSVLSSELPQTFSERFTHLKTAAQLAIVAGELGPANEAIRLSIFGVTEAATHSPVAGAISFGLSTLAVEASAAIAAASLFETDASKNLIERARVKAEKCGFSPDAQPSNITKAGIAFFGGSVPSMLVEQFVDPTRTIEQNRLHGVRTSIWVAGGCAVVGAMGSEGIEFTFNNPMTTAVVAGGLGTLAATKWATKRLRVSNERDAFAESWQDRDKRYSYRLVEDDISLEKAAITEQDVWDEKSYGNLVEEGYSEHIANSRTFASFEGEDCIGMTRMFRGGEDLLPPFMDMPFNDEADRQEIAEQCAQGMVEELGTVAVVPEARGKGVNTRLWRLAYRDARARGIESWGIIMEPERVQNMNKHHGFTFRQLGEAVDYQGGACAAHIMNLDEVDKSMRRKHPLSHYWFVKKPLKP